MVTRLSTQTFSFRKLSERLIKMQIYSSTSFSYKEIVNQKFFIHTNIRILLAWPHKAFQSSYLQCYNN